MITVSRLETLSLRRDVTDLERFRFLARETWHGLPASRTSSHPMHRHHLHILNSASVRPTMTHFVSNPGSACLPTFPQSCLLSSHLHATAHTKRGTSFSPVPGVGQIRIEFGDFILFGGAFGSALDSRIGLMRRARTLRAMWNDASPFRRLLYHFLLSASPARYWDYPVPLLTEPLTAAQ